jgi:hypothetical protein
MPQDRYNISFMLIAIIQILNLSNYNGHGKLPIIDQQYQVKSIPYMMDNTVGAASQTLTYVFLTHIFKLFFPLRTKTFMTADQNQTPFIKLMLCNTCRTWYQDHDKINEGVQDFILK